ncbi:MAG: hypothetical protein JWP81_5143 [Ferruginibacter sp.]|nr:hypothetical protein [Ferruginibacter sp.]
MNKKFCILKLLLLIFIFQCTIPFNAKATDEKYAALPLRGSSNQIAVDSFNLVQDTVFYNLALRPTQTTFNINNFVTFKLDEFANVFLPDTFRVTITFKVYFTKLVGGNLVQDSSAMQILYVEYNKFRNYQSKAVYTFNGGFQSKVKVFSITSSASSGSFAGYKNVLMLENEIQVTREYAFNPNSNVIQSIAGALGSLTDADSCSSAGEFMINWGKVAAADEYDLEWTYIDSTAISNYYVINTTTIDPKKVFTNNATRVSITFENYQVPILYDNGGILFFRVRPVRIKQNGQRIEAAWSSAYPSGMGSYGFAGHERSLNWQSSTSYAEDGKRKSVVQYFDGVLKTRQTVTKDNNTCFTVVAETMYDYQGRAAIQVMPAPILNRLIGYTPHFNRAVNGSDYEKNIFDADTTGGLNNCNAILQGMGTMSGASLYYSSSNTLVNTGFNKYIPNANLFPFTETRYTPDNTGRIAMQSEVGKEFQINQLDPSSHSHESRYFYGSADQEELDALFGTEVGNASHYSKNMVRDANGQYSVSYVDMHGRTIATALAGKPESNLDTLVSSNNKTIVKRLLDTTNNLVSGTSVISSKSLIVTRAGFHRLQYSLLPDSISIQACDNATICYDCIYDLEVAISNDCSNPGNQPVIIRRTNVSIAGLMDTACNQNVIFPAIDTSVNLTEGSYLITKTLTISQSGLNKYNEIFLRRNTCKILQQFIDEQRALLLARIQCYPTCQACMDSLGTWASYRVKYMLSNNISPADSASFREQALLAFEAQKASCDEMCSNTGLQTSIRQQMLTDMTPPYGQYAEMDSAYDINNVFHGSWWGIWSLRFKQLPVGVYYKDEFGRPDSLLNDALKKVPPTDRSITAQNFLDNFKDTWAEALLTLHPEYCHLLKYDTYASSHVWDERFAKIETFKQAVDSGFLNPSAFTGLPANSNFTAPVLASRDPFFTSLEPGYAAAFKDSLLNLVKAYSPAISAWSFATIMAHCDSADSNCINTYKTLSAAFTIDSACRGEQDVAWRYFREMYLNKKAEIINSIIFNNCPNPAVLPWHTLNFPNINAIDGSNAIPVTASVGTDSLNNFIANNCKAYVAQWLDEMKPCNLTTSDSDQIISRLIGVCKAGGNIDHLYGSSTTKPGTNANGDTSFIQVLKAVLGSRYDSTCNAYLVTAPKPYDKQPPYGDIEVWTKPDSCQCTRITSLYQKFQSSADTTFSDYVLRVTGTRINAGVLDTLRMLCSGQVTCKFLASPMTLPPALQCSVANTCVDCVAVNSLYNRFKLDFPGIIPAYVDTDSVQIKRNRLFENFMNYNLGFSKSTSEYLSFLNTCGNFLSGSCDSLKNIVSNFIKNVRVGKVVHTLQTQEGQVYSTLSQIVDNGTIRFPDSIRAKPDTWFNNYGSGMAYNNTFCTSNGYSVEIRFKFLSSNKTGDVFYTSLGGFDFTGHRNHVDNNGIYRNGLFTEINNVVYILDPNTSNSVLQNWMTIKIKVLPNSYSLYFNNSLIVTFPTTLTLGNRTGFGLGLWGRQGCIDRLKVWDSQDNLRFFEDFNDALNPAFVDSSFICPTPLNCRTSFKNYFNSQKGTSYTYTQIDSFYFAQCSIHPAPCDAVNSGGLLLCSSTKPVFSSIDPKTLTPCADSTLFSVGVGTKLQNAYRDSLVNSFNDRYLAKCLKARYYESFTITAPVSEFHYTLYYYDQAGNLVKTVPPAGVDVSKFAWAVAYSDSIKISRAANNLVTPAHALVTNYRYNTLNQVVAQYTPDAGASKFWYDRLGRLVISQNAKQKANSATELNALYSYTRYDYLGRIAEVGQIRNINATEPVTNLLTRNNALTNTWFVNRNNVRGQITTTFYDSKYAGYTGSENSTIWQRNLRNRVSFTSYTDTANLSGFNTATLYSYDIHGNVDTLLQDFGVSTVTGVTNIMNVQTTNANRWKRMVYKYDLISGKVNHVAYQPPRGNTYYPDMFYHRYSYDAENRLILAETSMDSVVWEKEARYDYYRHGPLARTTLGEQLVQGTDYAYTLQGWLKGVNSISLANGDFDMSSDGKVGAQNQYVARDALGFNLNYFAGDYLPINISVNPFPGASAYLPGTENRPLYNGNINSMAVNISFPNATAFQVPQLYNYKYDQLNRITGMDVYRGFNETSNTWSAMALTNDYKERVVYDANGNILKYLRNGTPSPFIVMDSLSYNYYPGTNRLKYVRDPMEDNTYPDDINHQPNINNYTYDQIGNLVSDAKDSLALIKWNVYGKITEIQRTASAARPITNIKYTYDAAGNRISKRIAKTGTTTIEYTWYVRDASGNVMSVYNSTGTSSTISSAGYMLNLTEQHMYGSSRVGVLNRNIDAKATFTKASIVIFTRGNKFFELSNHLGNVLVTVSDKKLQHTANNTTVDYYNADVVTANDYYPFGMLMPGRRYSWANSLYRYGFNGKEKDNETYGDGNEYDYGFRIYNPRLGRFLSMDPLTKSFPWYTPYQYAGNKPILCIDLDGLEDIPATGSNIPAPFSTQQLIKSALNDGFYKGPLGRGETVLLIQDYRVVGNPIPIHKEFVLFQGDINKPINILNQGDVTFNENGNTGPGRGPQMTSGGTIQFGTPEFKKKMDELYPEGIPINDVSIKFGQNSRKLTNENDIVNKLKPVADFLNKYPETKVSITGNTNLKQPPDATINSDGKDITIKDLMDGRATTLKSVLTDKLNVDATQVTTMPGVQGTNTNGDIKVVQPKPTIKKKSE